LIDKRLTEDVVQGVEEYNNEQ